MSLITLTMKKKSNKRPWIEGDKPECNSTYWVTLEMKSHPGPASRCVVKLFYCSGEWNLTEFDNVTYNIIAHMPYCTPMPYNPGNPTQNPFRNMKG